MASLTTLYETCQSLWGGLVVCFSFCLSFVFDNVLFYQGSFALAANTGKQNAPVVTTIHLCFIAEDAL